MIGTVRQSHQGFDCGDEVICDSATDAAVRQFQNIFRWASIVGAGFQNVAVDPQSTELIDQDREPFSGWISNEMTNERCFSRAEKTRDDSDGDFGQIGHDSSKGGRRARLCLRKMMARS